MVIQVGKFCRRVRKPDTERYQDYRPPVTLIVPFKGFDHDLKRGIRAMLKLDYPQYRLLAVVESEDDPALAVLRETLAEFPAGPAVEIVVAGLAPDNIGQKVHNQLAAFDHLARRDPPWPTPTWWCFADSDAVPHARWLGQLVGPLANEYNGVTTGYRWLIPQLAGAASALGQRVRQRHQQRRRHLHRPPVAYPGLGRIDGHAGRVSS